MVASANRNGHPCYAHSRTPGPFDQGMGIGLPDHVTVHLDAGDDSGKTRDLLTELGCHSVSIKGPAPGRPPLGHGTNQLMVHPRLPQTPDLHRERRLRHQR